jgi:serine phosphatase RsbU (regulator of sigma subunit)
MKPSFFENIPLFSRLNPDELELFEYHGRLVSYQAGEFIFREGEPARFFWLLQKGEIEIIKIWGGSEEKLLQVMHPGDFFGELGVVYQNHIRTASARAAVPVTLLEIPLIALVRLLEKQSNLALPVMREAVARFLRTESAATQDLVEKNLKLAQSLAELKAVQAQLIQQEKLRHELEMAHQIQESFLPRQLPDLPGWEMSVHWKPARQVSGDFYDFLPLRGGKLALVIGDVSGKGMPSALVMAVTRSITRAALRNGGKAGVLLSQINDLLVEEMPPAMFVTAFLALIDTASGVINYANAGHCLPFKCCSTGSTELRATGMPLGLMPGMVYEEKQMLIAPNDWLLFYSDALTESHNPGGQMFGIPRLYEMVHQAGCQGAAPEIIRSIIDSYEKFTGPDVEQEDDLTLIVLRRSSLSA